MKRIDPQLLRRVDRLATSQQEVEAVITVQDLAPLAKTLEPEETDSLVHHLLQRVTHVTGLKPSDVSVQRNLGTFVIQARASYIKTLLEQSEVHHAALIDNSTPLEY
jgi:hypothetical protein